MVTGLTLTQAQSALQRATRERARATLSGVAEQVRHLATPEERFAATRPAYEQLVKQGLLRQLIPAPAGGEGNGMVEMAILAEELYAVDASVSLTAFATLIGLLPLSLGGSPEQVQKFLPPFLAAEGAPLAGFCHSEPGGIANFASPPPAEGLRTTARLQGDEWVINGEKRWVSSATGWDGKGADLLTVVCRTAEDFRTPAERALSVIIVPGPAKGFVAGPGIDMIGHRGHLAPSFRFENVRVPAGNIIGPIGAGKALIERSFAGPAALVGIFGTALMRAAFEFALDFARREHRAGPHAIIDYQAVGYALADAKTRLEATRWLSYRACHALDGHEPAASELAIHAKIFGSETAVSVITDLMSVVGVESYDADNPLGRLLQDALALPLFAGGNLGVRRRQLHQTFRSPGYDPLATVSSVSSRLLTTKAPEPTWESNMIIDTRSTSEFTTQLFIGGTWRPSTGGTFTDLNPATGEPLTEVAAGTAEDIEEAVRAAREALEGVWRKTPGSERGRLLNRIADLVERDAETLIRLESLDIGKPSGQPAVLDIPNTIATFRHFAGWADKIQGSVIPTNGYFGRPTHSYTVREPVGVIGAIIPWNTPLMIASWKLAPALAAGNTVVVKPAADAPLSILHLATLIEEAGVPAGVVNVVPGRGSVAGTALVEHPDVDKISFTGSPEVGRQIQVAAAGTFKRVTLELGGKTPQIILADADVEAAVHGTAMGLFFNQGETCAAGTRILVHRSRYDQVVDALAGAANAQVLGDPFDPSTTMGALVNAAQQQRVLDYIARGQSEGARLVAGGTAPMEKGFFVAPTIFADVDNGMTIAREEIFGPVGAVIPFDDVDEAIRIANETRYGLAATIWTRDVSAAHSLAARVRAGAVWVNGWAAIDPALPWGGMKTSGIGRELGWAGILANTEEKVVTVVL